MAELHELSPPSGSRRDGRRKGRGPGSGLGKTAGRGHKGQKARTGGTIPPGFEGGQMPLHRRIPKRGFTPLRRTEYQVVNVSALERLEESEVTPEVLKAHGLIGSTRRLVKVLGDGSIQRPVQVHAHAFSASAREKIEGAGGSATVLGAADEEPADQGTGGEGSGAQGEEPSATGSPGEGAAEPATED